VARAFAPSPLPLTPRTSPSKQSNGVLLRASSSKSWQLRPARICNALLVPMNGPLARAPFGPRQHRKLLWTTIELIMIATYDTPAAIRVRSRGSGLVAAVRTWWMSRLTRQIAQAAIIQLHRMSDRELQDIGLTRCQIEQVVREFTRRH
jgi:uncharacterized protein YjiS (DUF1127 family)